MACKCVLCGYPISIVMNSVITTTGTKICNRCASYISEQYIDNSFEEAQNMTRKYDEISIAIEKNFPDTNKYKDILFVMLSAYTIQVEKKGYWEEIRTYTGGIVRNINPKNICYKNSEVPLDDQKKIQQIFLIYTAKKDKKLVEIIDLITDKNTQEVLQESEDDKISIKEYIDKVKEVIKGQDKGVVDVGRYIYRHLMRCRYNLLNPDEPITLKENLLVIGPTGVGKTATIEEFCSYMDIPCIVIDMTSYTKAGYVGANFEDAIKNLIRKANDDVQLAENGIIVLDEGDKNANNSVSRPGDPGGESMMYEMLKKIEGSDIQLGDGKTFNSRNVLFICMGTFTKAYDARRERVEGKKSIGFTKNESKEAQFPDFVPEDLIKSGVPKEWVGRFSGITEFKALTEANYLDILKNSSKSAYIQTKKLLEFSYNVKLDVDSKTEKEIVKKAMKYDVGARGLTRAMAETLKEIEAKLIMERESLGDVINI